MLRSCLREVSAYVHCQDRARCGSVRVRQACGAAALTLAWVAGQEDSCE